MTTATAIRTIEDLFRILDDNPEWVEALRARLLTQELLELPDAFAKFVKQTNRRFDEVDRQFVEVNRRFDELSEETNRRFDEQGRAIQRLQDSVGALKGAHAMNVAAGDYGWMTRSMGLQPVKLLPADEKDELALRLRADGVPEGDVQSFRRADMIIEAQDADGEKTYIAAEVSYTVNGRDTDRAMRNAKYLASLTGKPARAAVVGSALDNRVRPLIDSGEVYWHFLSEREMQPD